MATVTKKLMFDMMQSDELPYWCISDNSEKTIAENDTDENLESATAKLKKSLSQVRDTVVWIKLCSVPKASIGKGGNKYRYWRNKVEISEEESTESAKAAPLNDAMLKLIKENNDLRRQIDRIEDQKKVEALERRIDDMGKTDIWSKLLSNPQVVQGIGNLLGVPAGTMQGLAGVKGADLGEIKVDVVAREQKIKASVMRLIKVDPDFDKNLELLAEFAEQYPGEYKNSIDTIRKML